MTDSENTKTNKQALVKSGGTGLASADPFRRYLAEVNQYPILSLEEEKELAEKVKLNGDKEAAKKLVTSHLRLVAKIAMNYRSAYGNMLDLVQEGNVGLLRSLKTFDPDKGVRLASYASWWIRSYILKYILDNFRLIKIGTTQAQRSLFFNLMKEKKKLEEEGFKADSKTLANRLNVKPKEVEEMSLRLSEGELSMDAPTGDGQNTFADFIHDPQESTEDQVESSMTQDILIKKIKDFSEHLNEREQKILGERLMAEFPMTLQQIADEYGISRERARQVEERLKKRLKEFLEASGLSSQDMI